MQPHLDWSPGDTHASPDSAAFVHLERSVRRQVAMFGPGAALRYVARLVEVDDADRNPEELYEEVAARLGTTPDRVRQLLERPRLGAS